MSPLFIVNGAPAVGKSTLCRALMARFERGLHIEVDVLREWVVSGIAHPMDWTEETIRQFRLAEEAAIDVALRYQDAGFAVAVDHCRRPQAWDEVLNRRCAGRPVVRIMLDCGRELNLRRNRERTNKDFEPAILEALIGDLALSLPAEARELGEWTVIDNVDEGIESAVEAVLQLAKDRAGQDAGA